MKTRYFSDHRGRRRRVGVTHSGRWVSFSDDMQAAPAAEEDLDARLSAFGLTSDGTLPPELLMKLLDELEAAGIAPKGSPGAGEVKELGDREEANARRQLARRGSPSKFSERVTPAFEKRLRAYAQRGKATG